MNFFYKVFNKLKYIGSQYQQVCNVKREYNREKIISQSDNSPRIYYTGFPGSLDDDWIKSFALNSFLPEKYKNCRLSVFDPDIEYFTVFTHRKIIKKSKAKNKIFWTGEDVVNNFTEFSDHGLDICDLSLGFLPEDDIDLKYRDKYVRFPLWLLYYFLPNSDSVITKDKISKIVSQFNERNYNKTQFCALVAGHDRSGIRKQLLEHLSLIEFVKSAGRIYHNDDALKTDFADDKIKYLNQFMFNICPENTDTNGYVTEKLFQAFDAGCIPIYNGGGNYLEPEVINGKAVIYYDGSNIEQVLSQVTELWKNPKYYKEFIKQPRLLPSATDYIYERILDAKNKFMRIR